MRERFLVETTREPDVVGRHHVADLAELSRLFTAWVESRRPASSCGLGFIGESYGQRPRGEGPRAASRPRSRTSPRPASVQPPATLDTCDPRHILAVTSRSTDDEQEGPVAEHPTPVVSGSAVGIIPNPMSGRDIRRVVAQASVFPNTEKTSMVLRIVRAVGRGTAGERDREPAVLASETLPTPVVACVRAMRYRVAIQQPNEFVVLLAGVRRFPPVYETRCLAARPGQNAIIDGHPRARILRLGVKWSQVQILSARLTRNRL